MSKRTFDQSFSNETISIKNILPRFQHVKIVNDFEIIVDSTTNFFNLSELCAFHNKDAYEWMCTETAKSLKTKNIDPETGETFYRLILETLYEVKPSTSIAYCGIYAPKDFLADVLCWITESGKYTKFNKRDLSFPLVEGTFYQW